jgi:hypothetical protein
MQARRFKHAPLALAFLTALTVTACGQSPNSAPSAPKAATQDVEATAVFRSANEQAVFLFVREAAGTRKVTQIEVSKTGDVRTFKATALVLNPGSMFWPQYDKQRWEGTMKSEGPTRNPDRTRVTITGRYLDALAGQKMGAGPWVTKVVEI